MLNFVYVFRVYMNKTPITNKQDPQFNSDFFLYIFFFHFVCHNDVCDCRIVYMSVRKIILLLANTDTRNKEAEVN